MRASRLTSLLMLLMGTLFLSAPQDAYSAETMISASDDAYVQQRRPNTNKGVTSLKVVNDGKQINSYIMFHVGGLTGPVTSATVRMKLRASTPDAGALYSVSNNLAGSTLPWTEHNIT